jgi:cytoskeletal protein RodZ
MKKRVVTIVIVLATVVLAGVAVYTAIRLYQLRQEAVAPTAPTSEPAAAEPKTNTCTQLSFVLAEESSPSPSPSESSSPTPTPSSPTPIPSSTATTEISSPNPQPSLPSTGVDYPTFLGVGLGAIALIVSLLLAL